MMPVALTWLFGPLGTTEILIIALVLVLLFGARKIPELARGLGRGISEFKSGMREGERKGKDQPASRDTQDGSGGGSPTEKPPSTR